MNWQTIRVAYFDKDKDHLLLNGVKPVIKWLEAQPSVLRVYQARHWKFGPHIDIAVAQNEETTNPDIVLSEAVNMLNAYLSAHPSNEEIDETQYLELSEKLGKLELDAGPYAPLLTNNTVSITEYNSNEKMLRGKGLRIVKEDFHSLVNNILFNLLEYKQQSSEKLLLALVEMLACVGEFYANSGILRGHLSFRSHAEHFFTHFDKNKSIRTKYEGFDAKLADEVDVILQRVQQEFKAQSFYANGDELMREWVQKLFILKSKLANVVMLEHEQVKDPAHFFKIADDMFGKDGEEFDIYKDNPFFKVFYQGSDDSFFERQDFIVYRSMVNHFYYMLPTLSVSPIQKHLVCFLVANSVERLFNVTWEELLLGNSKAATSANDESPDQLAS